MWVTNRQMAVLEVAVDMLQKYSMSLVDEEYIVLLDAKKTLDELREKHKKNNARCAAYVAEKRKTNPEYAGNKRKRQS